MSRPTNNLALTNSDIIFKTFVKEKNETNVEIEDKRRSKLAFHGHQAKLAYDEIITHVKSQDNQRKSVPQACSESSTVEPKLKNTQIKNVNSKERNINLLFKAIESGDIAFISQNFDSENVNMSDQFGWTPLMSAAYSGHIEIVNFLLNLGANTKIKDKSGLTAIELAMKRNHLDIINLLKQRFHKRKDNSSCEGVPGNSKNNVQRVVDEESFYCDVCKIVFTESSRFKHETSTLHVFNGNPKLRNAYYGIPRQNKGYQILLNTGWDEENGLGPSGEGQKYPVKTILKRDRKGLGQGKKDTPRVTHFEPRDTDAVKFVNRHKRKARTKRDLAKQMKRDAAKTRAWRNSMS